MQKLQLSQNQVNAKSKLNVQTIDVDIEALKELNERIEHIKVNDTEGLINFIQDFNYIVHELEQTYTREEIINHIQKIRLVFSDSPFINRTQNWPKGYQGDFETIEYIIYRKNKAIPGTLGYMIEDFFINSDICKQHINKVKNQAALIDKAIDRKSNAQIMSIGCGTSEDVKLNLNAIKNSKATFTLVDADMDAINYSLQALADVKDSIDTVYGNIYKIVRNINEKFDLILIGGVFDYLSDKAIVKVLSSLKENLNEGGTIFFTNIKKNNPYRIVMEYCSSWTLIERSEGDIKDLLNQSGLDNSSVSLQLDETGLTYMVEIKL